MTQFAFYNWPINYDAIDDWPQPINGFDIGKSPYNHMHLCNNIYGDSEYDEEWMLISVWSQK